jgi:hypothetical protein
MRGVSRHLRLDFGILSGDEAGSARALRQRKVVYRRRAVDEASRDPHSGYPALDSMENRHKIYLVLYGPRRETSAFPEKEA